MKYHFKVILLLTGCCLVISAFAFSLHPGKYQNDVLHKGLRGRVKSYTQYFYEPIKGNTVVSDVWKYNTTNNFNKQGNATAEYFYTQEKLAIKWVYLYDNEGRQVLATGEPDQIIRKSAYYYNAKNNLVEKTFSQSVPRSIIIYNKEGYRDTMYSLSREGKLISKVIYHYDVRNNTTSEIGQDARGRVKYKTVYRYDSHDNKIEERRTDAHGKAIYSIRLKYNSMNNMITRVDSNLMYIRGEGNPVEKEGSNIHIRTFNYDGYDHVGNWLIQTEVLNNQTIRIIKRQFVYY